MRFITIKIVKNMIINEITMLDFVSQIPQWTNLLFLVIILSKNLSSIVISSIKSAKLHMGWIISAPRLTFFNQSNGMKAHNKEEEKSYLRQILKKFSRH